MRGSDTADSGDTAVGVTGYYKHKVSSLSVTPTVSWPLGGGLTISSASTYQTKTTTPYFSLDL